MIERLYTYWGTCTDPHRNLALEEYLTDIVPQNACTLYLWQNKHTVVIGRNQNAWQECRTAELERDGGTLARRLSGGGAVYHDLGNLNFTFCVPTALYDLPRQQRVIVEACRRLGIDACVSGRNDILANGLKFSGNSFYAHNGRSFHNGTLLIDTDIEHLGRYLTPSTAKLSGKGVASVRARVVNLRSLQPSLTVEAVGKAMQEAFGAVYGLVPQPLSEADFDARELQARYERFHSFQWVYGRNIPFTFSVSRRFDWGEVTVQLSVEKGLCTQAAVYTDAMNAAFAAPLARELAGCLFSSEALCRRVEALPACEAVAAELCAMLREQDI